MIISQGTIEQFHEITSSGSLVLVDFYADWCEPCKWLDSILEEVISRISVPLQVLKIDTEAHHSLVREYGIKSVPVLIVFKDSKPVWRMNGFLTTDELIVKLEDISRGTLDSVYSM